MKRNQKTQVDRVQKEKFVRTQFPVLLPRGDNQTDMLDAMKYSTMIVAQGSAGVGKTMLACWHAAKKLHFGDVKKVILLRCYQPLAGRTIGFTPGDSDMKLMPYYQQMVDYLEDYLGKASTEIHLKQKTIELCSLETIRGRSWKNCIIIVDESQNLFVPEVQALVTRLGESSQMIFCGDNTGIQSDVKNGMDGLTYLYKLSKKYSIPDIEFINFTRDDIQRSDITKNFVIAFEDEMIAEQKGEAIITKALVDNQHKKSR
jgi:phosphate starvation-inducible protein PhoH and related proteins